MKKAMAAVLALGVVFACWGLSAAEDEAPAIKGDAGCAKCSFGADACAAAVKVGDTVYTLQASDKASEATQKLIASFKGAAKAVAVVIKGEIKDKTIVADAVAKVETKKEETGGCGGCN